MSMRCPLTNTLPAMMSRCAFSRDSLKPRATSTRSSRSFMRLNNPPLDLRLLKKLAAAVGDDHVFFERHHPGIGHDAQFERVHLPGFDDAIGRIPIARPARPEQRRAIVGGTAQLVTERMLIFRVACACDDLARALVDAPAFHAGLERAGAFVNGLCDGVKRLAQRYRCARFAGPPYVPHALQV